jgi:hypothetical protein
MKMSLNVVLLTAGLTLLASGIANAGSIELQVMQGDVLVDQGEGLVPVKESAVIIPGSRVVMRDNSAAVLNYAEDQCFIRLAPASVINITEEAPCANGSFAATSRTTLIEPANGVYEVLPPPPPQAGVSALIAGGGFAATVAFVGVYSIVSEEMKDKPVSQH